MTVAFDFVDTTFRIREKKRNTSCRKAILVERFIKREIINAVEVMLLKKSEFDLSASNSQYESSEHAISPT